VLENKRRPKTINLHHRQGGQTRSRQAPIPLGKRIDEAALFELAKNLLGQVILEGRVWPCSNISLSVGGFEDGIVGNMGIGSFLVKGDEAKALSSNARKWDVPETGQERPEKRRRLEPMTGIQKFFGKPDSTEEHNGEFGAQYLPGNSPSAEGGNADSDEFERRQRLCLTVARTRRPNFNIRTPSRRVHRPFHQQHDYICSRCNQALESADGLDSHHDWHFAKDLQDEENGQHSRPPKAAPSKANKKPR